MATPELVDLFENYLAGGSGAAEKLQRTLSPSSNTQYVKRYLKNNFNHVKKNEDHLQNRFASLFHFFTVALHIVC